MGEKRAMSNEKQPLGLADEKRALKQRLKEIEIEEETDIQRAAKIASRSAASEFMVVAQRISCAFAEVEIELLGEEAYNDELRYCVSIRKRPELCRVTFRKNPNTEASVVFRADNNWKHLRLYLWEPDNENRIGFVCDISAYLSIGHYCGPFHSDSRDRLCWFAETIFDVQYDDTFLCAFWSLLIHALFTYAEKSEQTIGASTLSRVLRDNHLL